MARSNRHPGDCAKCGAEVAAGAGTLEGPPWRVYCTQCLPRVEPGVKFEVCGPRVRASLTGYLGDTFEVYRTAMRGWDFNKNTKNHTAPPEALPTALTILRGQGVPVYVDDDVEQLLQRAADERAAEIREADGRAAEVDAALAKIGGALYPYQRTGVRWLAGKPAALLADDMGLGKTLQALVAAPERAPILVICPAVAKGVWQREARKWRPDLEPVVLKGRKSFRWPVAGQMVVTNYDILPPSVGPAPEGCVVVADEAHAIKNNKALRTKRFRDIADETRKAGGRVWLATGTPLLNKPPELWALLVAAGLEKQTFGSWGRFAPLMGGYQIQITARGGRKIMVWEWRDRRSPDVAERLRSAMLRRIKEDVLEDLPALRYERLLVNGLDTATRKLADEALDAIGADLEQAEALTDATADLERIPFELISAAATALATTKIPAMLELVEQHEEQEVPLVVFSAHRAPVDELGRRSGWAAITGDTPPARRTEIEDAFQEGQLKGVAATIQAGGVAITLTRASRAVFVDRLFTPALNAQARDRIYRIGQTRGVLITDLVADHPLDHRINELLVSKEQLISDTVDAARVDGDRDVAAEELQLLSAVEAQDVRNEIAAFKARLAELQAQVDAEQLAAARAAEEAKLYERIARRCKLWGIGDNGEAPRRGPVNDIERHAAEAIRQLTAMDPDHAEKENEVGWSKADGYVGHALAHFVAGGLTDGAWQMAANIVRKYHRQVGVA